MPVATVTQIWHSFRSEDYRRHRVIGRLALLNMSGALASAAAFTVEHLRSDSLAEKVGWCMLSQDITSCSCTGSLACSFWSWCQKPVGHGHQKPEEQRPARMGCCRLCRSQARALRR